MGEGWSLSGMLTTFFRPQDSETRQTIEPTFVVEREIGERASAFVEYVADAPTRGRATHIFNSGALYRLTPMQQIDFHAGTGLSDGTPDWFIGVGYSIRFDRLF
jgi:hypothetical protein